MIYSFIGYYSLILGLIISLPIFFFSIKNLKNNKILDNKIISFSFIQLLLVVISFFGLILSFVYSDFSNETVFNNSHTTKPLFYKISGTWGNHEGSLMLWLIVLTFFSFLFLISNKNHPKNYRLYTLVIQNLLILGFLIFILFNSNPFSLIAPTPQEGLGLNPILQDPALAIHPPLLYIGFVGSSIYFSAAIASLISGYADKSFAKSIKSWVLISWCFQTLGILVGSIWAYYELGWGGFWFWDPVENASLLPWFAMTALLHSIMVLEKRNLFYFWVIILCLITFTLSVMGTFLVRSGILNSVHTFASDPNRGVYILLFLSLIIFCSLYFLFRKYEAKRYFINFNSKETFVLINNWFMMFYLITVLIGTIYPIFTDVISKNKVSVGPPFYNSLLIPVVVIFLIFMAIGPKTKWIRNNYFNLKVLTTILIASIFINFLIGYFVKSYSFLSNVIIISSLFLIISSLIDFIETINKPKFDISRIISHFAFGLLILSIGLNHIFSIEKDFNIKLGETKNFDSYQLKLQKLELKNFPNYKAVIGELVINNKEKNVIDTLSPEIRIYNNPQTITYEAAIKTNLLKDYYLTMSNVDRSDYYNIKFQKKPFMIWIWISIIMISLGGALRLLKR